MNSIPSRLRDIANDNYPNLKEFGKACGIPYRSLQSYLQGERTIGSNVLIKIFRKTDININWLLTGEGKKYIHPKMK